MSDMFFGEKPANPKADEWAEGIAAQQRSEISVRQFCQDNGLTEYSFYTWRKGLQESAPVAVRPGEEERRAVGAHG
jgi:hypothetical protein